MFHPFPLSAEEKSQESTPRFLSNLISKMLKAIALFTGTKSSNTFNDYYDEWFKTLKNTLLPLLRRSISNSSHTLLSIHVDSLLHHFLSYYRALDIAASHDVAQLLYPVWRNPIEIPFLWLGDFHPYLFTNLLRSFLDDNDEDEEDDESGTDYYNPEDCADFDQPWEISMAWKNPSEVLITRIDQIECGLRLMVPELVTRLRNAQAGFVERVSGNWVRCEGKNKEVVKEAAEEEMEEIATVFMNANRLRRGVLLEITGVTSVYQAALFLEKLAQFVVGFKDSELVCGLKRCKLDLHPRQSWL